MRNAEIAAAFEELGTLYELDGAVIHRVLAYRNAAKAIRDSGKSVAELAARVPSFPAQHLWQADFFALGEAETFDLIIEQTFFCALTPTLRPAYAQQCAQLLRPGGKLVGLLFDTPFAGATEPPFGGSRDEYVAYFRPYFRFVHFEPAYNSLPARAGRELFICLQKL